MNSKLIGARGNTGDDKLLLKDRFSECDFHKGLSKSGKYDIIVYGHARRSYAKVEQAVMKLWEIESMISQPSNRRYGVYADRRDHGTHFAD